MTLYQMQKVTCETAKPWQFWNEQIARGTSSIMFQTCQTLTSSMTQFDIQSHYAIVFLLIMSVESQGYKNDYQIPVTNQDMHDVLDW
jgi:hypothetical protein